MNFSEIHWSTQVGLPILTLLQVLPLFAVGLIFGLRKSPYVRQLGLFMAVAELGLLVYLWHYYEQSQTAMQFAEHWRVLGPLAYHAAVDGVSVLFMLLTGLLVLLLSIYGPVRGLGPAPLFLMLLFAVEASLMSLFATVNLLWFSLMSVVELALVGVILWRWAISPEKDFALARFYQFMAVGVLLLLLGTLMLGWNYSHQLGGAWSFDLFDLAGVAVPVELQSVVFFLLFYGLAVRTPLFPLHGWLPLIARHGNIAVAPTLLLGIKIGIYGLIRYVLPLLPDAVWQWHSFVVGFATVGVLYAALLAAMQTNMRVLLAFAVVSHTSLIVIGLFTLNHDAFLGSVILSVTFGLAVTALVMINGLVFKRTRSTSLLRICGLFDHIPMAGLAFLIAGMATIGMPGTPGFDAVHLLMEASIHRYGALLTIAAGLGNVVAAGFLLWAFQQAFLAPCSESMAAREIGRLSVWEVLLLGMAVLVLLGAGFYMEPWLALIDLSLQGLSALYGHG